MDGYVNQPLTPEAARKLQALDLEDKFLTTIEKIGQWEIATRGNWYVSFSGGKDSTVLAYIAAKYLASYRTPPHPLHLLFCDTGLEYPEIRKFAMSFPDFLQKRFPTVTIDFQRRRPRQHFFDVIRSRGYPIISKEVAKRVAEYRAGYKTAILEFNGERKSNNEYLNSLYNKEKWKFLTTATFLISAKCCDITKKEPAHTFEKGNNKFCMVGTMAEESALRKNRWMRDGCNAFEGARPLSKPMSFWLNQDVLHYIQQEDIPICSVYGDIMAYDGGNYYPSTLCDAPLKCTGCQRTGQINAAR